MTGVCLPQPLPLSASPSMLQFTSLHFAFHISKFHFISKSLHWLFSLLETFCLHSVAWMASCHSGISSDTASLKRPALITLSKVGLPSPRPFQDRTGFSSFTLFINKFLLIFLTCLVPWLTTTSPKNMSSIRTNFCQTCSL